MGSWSLAIVALVVLGYAGLSRRLERSVLTAPIVFVSAGLLLGGEVLGWLDLGIRTSGVRTMTLAIRLRASRTSSISIGRTASKVVGILNLFLKCRRIAP